MPRHSRGCKECRQRRIGCDLEWPVCRQCRVTSRSCSGPVRDSHIFINQTRTPAAASKGCHAEPLPARRAPSDTQHRSLLVRYDAPSATPVATAAYTSHFMRFLTPASRRPGQPGTPWLREVWASSACRPDSALDLSLRAAATAYCAVTVEARDLLRQACQLYGAALSRHSMAIRRGGGVPDLAAFCTTVTLAVFETVWSTGSTALTSHLAAARRMLCVASPELARNRIFQDLSLFVQYQTLFVMVISPADYRATTAGRESWNDMSHFYAQCERTIMDDLMLQLFRLGELFTRRESGQLTMDDISVCHEIDLEVDILWDRHQAEFMRAGGWPSEQDATTTSPYADPFTAMIDVYFAAVRLLRSVVATSESWGVAPARHDAQDTPIEPYSQIILDCSEFLRTAPTGCVMLRMFFPLTLVSLYSTSEGQRGRACFLLDKWLRISAFGGLCKIVQRRIDTIIC